MVRRGISVRPGGIRLGLPVVAAVLTVLAVPALLAMAGCASDGEAVALPSLESQAAAVTASPSSTADQSEADQRAEVEDAVRAYFAAANLAVSSGDTRPLRSAATSGCTCVALARDVERSFASGRIEGAGWQITSVSPGLLDGQVASVEVVYVSSPYRIVDRERNVLSSFPGHRVEAAVLLEREREGWLVSDVDHVTRVAL